MSTKEKKECDPTKTLTKLANQANSQIQNNKFILETIEIYQNQIHEIKKILNSNKNENTKILQNNNNKNIKFINDYINSLKSLKNKYNQEIKKLSDKNNEYKSKLFNNNSIKQPLEKEEMDNFILKNTLFQLNSECIRYNSLLFIAKRHTLFQDEKRDISIDKKNGEYVIYDLSLDIQRDMLVENREFNKCINKIKSYQRKIKEKNKKINKYKHYIDTMKKNINKIGLLKKFDSSTNIFAEIENKKENIIDKNKKIFLEDEKNINYNNNKKKLSKKNILSKKIYLQRSNYQLGSDESEENKNENFSLNEIRSKNINLKLINKSENEEDEEEKENDEDINNNKNKIINYKKEKKKKKNKFEFLSLDELFDISNYEGKNEEIIDDELHSNDEATFETKIKPEKKIINDYIKQIKKEIPMLNFSQIEFNKTKIMNEADLYSLQRRNFEVKNIDGRIDNIKKKIKKIKKKLKLNIQKYKAMRNFILETKDNYNKILRPLKIKSTVEGGNIDFKIQNLLRKNDGGGGGKNEKIQEDKKQNVIEEELVGSDYSDEDKYEEEGNNEINIIGDEDDDNNMNDDNNIYMKTQAEIKRNIGLNLINDDIIETKKKINKKKIKVDGEENGKFNSK